MDMQNVSNLQIPEGVVRTIHDKDNRLIWGRLNYDTKYAGDIYQQTYSGKNLQPIVLDSYTSNGITFTRNSDGSITINGTATANAYFNLNNTSGSKLSLESGATYTLSVGDVDLPQTGGTYNVIVQIRKDSPNMTYAYVRGTERKKTFTMTEAATTYTYIGVYGAGTVVNNLTIYPQLELGSFMTSFEPYVGGIPSPNPDYPQNINVVAGAQTVTVSDGVDSEAFPVSLGSIELCKLGTYQDYIYKSGDDWYVHKATEKISSYNGETITTDYTSTTGSLTNGATVYYGLATATDTKITDATLIGQLNAIHQWLTRYGYNATVSGNLPLIVDRTNL